MNELDQDVVNLAKAIRKTESQDNPNAVGGSGEYGAYQFTPATWASSSRAFLGQEIPLQQATLQQQNEVAYKQIKQWKDAGYNVGQIASMWNAGKGRPDAYTQGHSGVNQYGVQYDTPAYAKKVAETYHMVKQQTGGTAGQASPYIQNPEALAPITSQNQVEEMPAVPEKKPGGLLGDIGRAIAQPVANIVARPFQLARYALDEKSQGKLGDKNFLGTGIEIDDPTLAKTDRESLDYITKDVGNAAQTVALGLGVNAVPKVLAPFATGSIAKGAITGALSGASAGALGSAGADIAERGVEAIEKPLETVGDTVVGGTLGALTGGILGGASGAIGKAMGKVDRPAVIAGREKIIDQLRGKNKAFDRALRKVEAKNPNTMKRIMEEDWIANSVDSDGTIRVRDQIQNLQEALQPAERVVRDNLIRENTKVNLEKLAQKMQKEILDQGIEGEALLRAQRTIKNEILGLAQRADANGNVPIVTLHDAKVFKYGNINYDNPVSKLVDKFVARQFKEAVEDNATSLAVKEVNKRLADEYGIIRALEAFDGQKVAGGRLGKYFAQTLGGIAGAKGGPLGSLFGAEVANKAMGAVFKSKLGAVGNAGADIMSDPLIQKAIASGARPNDAIKLAVKGGADDVANVAINKPKPLLLPSGRMGSQPFRLQDQINIPNRLQSVVDLAEAEARRKGTIGTDKVQKLMAQDIDRQIDMGRQILAFSEKKPPVGDVLDHIKQNIYLQAKNEKLPFAEKIAQFSTKGFNSIDEFETAIKQYMKQTGALAGLALPGTVQLNNLINKDIKGDNQANTLVLGDEVVGREPITPKERPLPPSTSENTIGGVNLGGYASDPNDLKITRSIYSKLPKTMSKEQIQDEIDRVMSVRDQANPPKAPVTADHIVKALDRYKGHFLPEERLVLAMLQKESAYGVAPRSDSQNNPGNILNTETDSYSYPTMQEGVDALVRELIRRQVDSKRLPKEGYLSLALSAKKK